ncbi:hypothetical protein GTC6_20535 [Gordonia terrae C-6]|uniref:Uncharacterized protein n=1 Tax=Gordonia terrae C-6 TaxID=1316928 RepID=R7Y447_9ACTN|nr:hypothetical protein GTC6_20535 [Gordonia terrae C-6]
MGVAAATLFGLILVGLVLAGATLDDHVPWNRLDFGNVPTWLSAVFSLLALGGIIFAALTYRINQQIRHDEEANQARLVLPTLNGFTHTGLADSRRTLSIEIGCSPTVYNGSTQPILFVDVLSVVAHLKSDPARVHAVRLSRAPGSPAGGANTLIPAHNHGKAETWIGTMTGQALDSLTDGVAFSIAARFTDAHGREWERLDNFAPHRNLATDESRQPPSELVALHRDSPAPH